MTRRTLATLTALASIGGCAPAVRIDVPDAVYSTDWSARPSGTTSAVATRQGSLGTLLGSTALDMLIADALARNPSLRAGDARAAQAAALVTNARAASLPVVTASLTAGGLRATPEGDRFTFRESFAAIDAIIDLDLAGRNRARGRGAAARYRAAQYDRDGLAIALESQIALAFVQRATLALRLNLIDQSISQASELDRIMRIRQREGEANRVDVGLQAIRLKQLQSERTRLDEALAMTRTALAALTGAEAPGFTVSIAQQEAIRVPQLAVPIPGALIERRPDIRAAEARLQAAGGDVAAARRAFYPSFGLSVGAVARSGGIGALNPLAVIGADLLAPIFARSRLRGDLQFSAASQREAAGLYRQAVLTALRDVEDALSAIDHARQREALLTEVEAEARTTSGLARRQYLEGDADLQQLLDAQDLLIAAQDAKALARQELLAGTIALYALTAQSSA